MLVSDMMDSCRSSMKVLSTSVSFGSCRLVWKYRVSFLVTWPLVHLLITEFVNPKTPFARVL